MLYWNPWAQVALAALLAAAVTILLDRRRMHRRNVEAVGFMPWTALSVLALMLALFAGSVAVAS